MDDKDDYRPNARCHGSSGDDVAGKRMDEFVHNVHSVVWQRDGEVLVVPAEAAARTVVPSHPVAGLARRRARDGALAVKPAVDILADGLSASARSVTLVATSVTLLDLDL